MTTSKEAYQALRAAEREHAEFVKAHPPVSPYVSPVCSFDRDELVEQHSEATVGNARKALWAALKQEHGEDVNAATEALMELMGG